MEGKGRGCTLHHAPQLAFKCCNLRVGWWGWCCAASVRLLLIHDNTSLLKLSPRSCWCWAGCFFDEVPSYYYVCVRSLCNECTVLLELVPPNGSSHLPSHPLFHSSLSCLSPFRPLLLCLGFSQVPLLFAVSSSQAAVLLADSCDVILPSSVARQLSSARWPSNWRQCLHEYLHALFLRSPDAAPDMHQLQVRVRWFGCSR